MISYIVTIWDKLLPHFAVINWEWVSNVHKTRAKAKLIKYATIPCVFKTQPTLPLFESENHNGYHGDNVLAVINRWFVRPVTCLVATLLAAGWIQMGMLMGGVGRI